jgi:hypothetical protein
LSIFYGKEALHYKNLSFKKKIKKYSREAIFSSTLALHGVQNHIESDLVSTSYSPFVFFKHLMQKWSSIFYGKEALHYKNLRFDKKITAGKFCRKMTGRNSRAGSISKGAENDAWTWMHGLLAISFILVISRASLPTTSDINYFGARY